MELPASEDINISMTTTISTLSSNRNISDNTSKDKIETDNEEVEKEPKEEVKEQEKEKEKEKEIEKDKDKDKDNATSQEKPIGAVDNKVRVLTYNIFMRPPPIHSFESDYKEDRIKLICKQFFQDYDVIAFQECFSFGSTRIDKIKGKAKKNGLVYFSNSKKKHSWNIGIDGGLCLLSRFPVLNKKLYYFKNGCHSDAYSEKGVLFNEIDMPNGNHLFLFTSHTQASYEHFPDITSESVRVRLGQFTEIRKFITLMTEKAKPTDIILLCGDLNVNGRLNKEDGKTHSEEYKAVLSILRGNLSIVRKDKLEKKKQKEKEKEGEGKNKSKGSKDNLKNKEVKDKSKESIEKNQEQEQEQKQENEEKEKEKEKENNQQEKKQEEKQESESTPNLNEENKKSQNKEKKKEDAYVDIHSETPEYEVEDLFYNELNEHPVTSCDLFADDYYKDGKGKKSKKCLDYFFKFTKINSTNPSSSNSNSNSNLTIEDLKINTFDVENQKFVHLSDHYGLSLNIVSHN